MKKQHKKYLSLIHKKLSGSISRDEDDLLQSWIAQSSRNREIYNEQQRLHKLTENFDKDLFSIDVDKEWEKFRSARPGAKVLNLSTYIRPALAVAAAVLLLFGLWFFFAPQKTYVANKENRQIVLTDGSMVKLHKGSKLVVQRGFDRTARRVKLVGEAYFVVSHDINKPFVVKSDGFVVQVVGTEFYVSQEEGQVVVNKGLVKVATVKTQAFVKAGESVIVRHKKIVRQKVDKNKLAWATGELHFDNTPLTQVFATLEANFGVKIIIQNKSVENLRLTATFRGQDLTTILNIIAQTEDIKIYKTGTKVYTVK